VLCKSFLTSSLDDTQPVVDRIALYSAMLYGEYRTHTKYDDIEQHFIKKQHFFVFIHNNTMDNWLLTVNG